MEIYIDSKNRTIAFEGEEYNIGDSLLSFIEEFDPAKNFSPDDIGSEHPYIKYFQQDKTTLAKAQEWYAENVYVCLDDDEKVWFGKKPSPIEQLASWLHDDDYNHSLDETVPVRYWAEERARDGCKFYEVYTVSEVSEVCRIEFMKMVEFDLNIRRCHNCNRYFAPKRDGDVKYCDRIPQGKKRTCQQIGSIKTFQKKVAENPLLGEYNKIYCRFFARKRSDNDSIRITPEQFKTWAVQAKKTREKAIAEDWTIEQLETALVTALETIQSI